MARSVFVVVCLLLSCGMAPAETRLFIPRFQSGPDSGTQIMLANKNGRAAVAGLWAFTTSGTLIGGHAVNLPAHGVRSLSAGEAFNLDRHGVQGWIGVFSAEDGIEVSYSDRGVSARIDSLEARAGGSTEQTVFVSARRENALWITNPNPFETSVTVYRKDAAGRILDLQEVRVRSFAQAAIAISNERAPETARLDVHANANVVAVEGPPQSAEPSGISNHSSGADMWSLAIESEAAVGAYQVVLKFDPSLVQFSHADVLGGAAPGFQSKPIVTEIDNTQGRMRLAAFQVGAAPSGKVEVARVRLARPASGAAPGIEIEEVTDIKGNSLLARPLAVHFSRAQAQAE